MRSFIYGSKNGIHIIDLDKTKTALEKALEFLKLQASQGRTILLASTKPQASRAVIQSAKETQMPFVVNKWMPGLFTNFSTIKRRIKYFNDLMRQEKEGDFEKYTKKEAAKLKKEIIKLEDAFGGVKDMDRLPNVVFVADVVKDRIIVAEANKMKVPVVAIVDTNANPDGVDYPIPANDDALSAINYVFDLVKTAILEGKGKNK